MASSIVSQAEYENVVLTRESLGDYYQKMDASKTTESIDTVYQKCVDMTKDKQVTDCIGAAAQKLSRNLKKKYKEAPQLVTRFTEEDRQSKTNVNTDTKTSDSGNSGAKTTTENKG